MTVPRFYHPQEMEAGQTVSLAGDNIHYAQRVLRMRSGDRLDLIDGLGSEYHAVVHFLSPEKVLVDITEKIRIVDPSVGLTFCQSLLKADKMDFIVQRSVELGVDTFIPFVSSRSVVRLTPVAAVRKVERWQKIAKEAARQCGRSHIPTVEPVAAYSDMIRMANGNPVKAIFWEAETERTLRQLFQSGEGRSDDRYFFVVGPEGGFSGEEICRAKEAGFLSVSIGKRVLKVETAVMSILAILQYERGIFHGD
ncbi:MAG: 16S rRNA (uracil(1498)-N(3))-methyltransferase [Syntrophaceae bacterium]|nr:16S rRNA (uracil(1498)-N(3))-methyltransferase [Syntrophaceae bacterium]